MYIVTDLTRMRNGKVCTAVVDERNGICYRPIPYFTYDRVRELNMLPGARLTGTFSINADADNPHVEDSSYRDDLAYVGPAARDEFRRVLDITLQSNVVAGFGLQLADDRYIPYGVTASRSIITIRVRPGEFRVHFDAWGKYRINFRDGSGREYRNIPVTDLGFDEFKSMMVDDEDDLVEIVNGHFNSSQDIYLRLGVGRVHKVGERNGYWLQVNGLYSFPSMLPQIRGYAP